MLCIPVTRASLGVLLGSSFACPVALAVLRVHTQGGDAYRMFRSGPHTQ